MPDAERELHTTIPAWATSAYAIAVFGGTLASVALLMRKAWSIPLFMISLVAILVQMGHALLMTRIIEVQGGGAAILPLLIILIAVYLAWYFTSVKKKGWLS